MMLTPEEQFQLAGAKAVTTQADDPTLALYLDQLSLRLRNPEHSAESIRKECAQAMHDAAAEIRALRETLDRYREDLWDALMQGTEQTDGVIDNRCLSTYEGLCATFAELGWLERVNGRMYRIVKEMK